MPMGPAEIVMSLKELCEEVGPRLNTSQIVTWIDRQGGYESEFELIAFAKKMKARQFARMLMYEDDETGAKVKRLWSLRDRSNGERAYHDIAQLEPEQRRKLISQYSHFLEQQKALRRAMTDYFAGQHFFDFYTNEIEESALSSMDQD